MTPMLRPLVGVPLFLWLSLASPARAQTAQSPAPPPAVAAPAPVAADVPAAASSSATSATSAAAKSGAGPSAGKEPAPPAASASPAAKPAAGSAEAGNIRVEKTGGNRLFRITEGMLVEGQRQKPNAFYVLQRASAAYDWESLDENFLQRIIKATEKPPF